jgi:hypothetical protein
MCLMTQDSHLHEVLKKNILLLWDWNLGVKRSQAYPSFSCSQFTTHFYTRWLYYCHPFWWMGQRYMPQDLPPWHQNQLTNWADVPHGWRWGLVLTFNSMVEWEDFAITKWFQEIKKVIFTCMFITTSGHMNFSSEGPFSLP